MTKTVVVKHPAKQTAVRPIWISAYYAIWVQRAGVLTPQKIDYTAFSHLIQFHDVPADDGTLDAPGNITPEEASAVVEPAHIHVINRHVLELAASGKVVVESESATAMPGRRPGSFRAASIGRSPVPVTSGSSLTPTRWPVT